MVFGIHVLRLPYQRMKTSFFLPGKKKKLHNMPHTLPRDCFDFQVRLQSLRQHSVRTGSGQAGLGVPESRTGAWRHALSRSLLDSKKGHSRFQPWCSVPADSF